MTIGLKWTYSQVGLIEDLIEGWTATIVSDEELKTNIEQHLNKLRSPFGFLANMGFDPARDTGNSTLDKAQVKAANFMEM